MSVAPHQILDCLQRIYQKETPPSVEDVLQLGKLLRAFGTGTIITDTDARGAVVSHFRGAIMASLTNQQCVPDLVARRLREMDGEHWQQAKGWLAKFARNIQSEIEARQFPGAPQLPVAAPCQRLFSWGEILSKIGRPNSDEEKRRIQRLNRECGGPITIKPSAPPMCDSAKLIGWWNSLESRWADVEASQRDRDATVASIRTRSP